MGIMSWPAFYSAWWQHLQSVVMKGMFCICSFYVLQWLFSLYHMATENAVFNRQALFDSVTLMLFSWFLPLCLQL